MKTTEEDKGYCNYLSEEDEKRGCQFAGLVNAIVVFALLTVAMADTTVISEVSSSNVDMLKQNGGAWSVLSQKSRVCSTNSGTSVTAENWSLKSSSATNPLPHSAVCTGWLLDDVDCRSEYRKRFICAVSNAWISSVSDELEVNGTGPSCLSSAHIISSCANYVITVIDGERMPVGLAGLYDLTDDMKRRLYVSENLIDGCYVYRGDVVGVDSNTCTVSLKKSMSPMPENIFGNSQHLRTLVIPDGVEVTYSMLLPCTNLESVIVGDVWSARVVLEACPTVTNLVFADSVTVIPEHLLSGCNHVESVTIPSSVVEIGDGAFAQCSRLRTVSFAGDAPETGRDLFYGTPRRLLIRVPDGSVGWNGDLSEELPSAFGERSIVHSGEIICPERTDDTGIKVVQCTVTNVVVHYVTRSVSADLAVPITDETAIVNVMTEIKGGSLAIPDSWKSNYSSFEEKFGYDFSEALLKLTGKKDAAGKSMFVWQDYVAGTDPTDPDSVFSASVSMVEGKPVISWSPELNADEAAKRVYKVFGKERLQDANWTEVTRGRESDYNFFKVTVEMK